MIKSHECHVLTAVLETPPKHRNMITDGVRRAIHDFSRGEGSFLEWWLEKDPDLAMAVQFCPLCGTQFTGDST